MSQYRAYFVPGGVDPLGLSDFSDCQAAISAALDKILDVYKKRSLGMIRLFGALNNERIQDWTRGGDVRNDWYEKAIERSCAGKDGDPVPGRVNWKDLLPDCPFKECDAKKAGFYLSNHQLDFFITALKTAIEKMLRLEVERSNVATTKTRN